MGLMTDADAIRRALQWRAAGHAVAIAVVTGVWRSAPRPVGARLVVRDDGEFCGSVSGGCVEAETITAALDVVADSHPRRLKFGVAEQTAWDNGLPCGGDIAILAYFLDDAGEAALHTALREEEARRPTALVTRVGDGRQHCAVAGDGDGDGEFTAAFAVAAERLAAGLPPLMWEDGGEIYFIEPLSPPPRLLLVGATHIAQALLPLAAVVEMPCVVIDPRTAWAAAARFPPARFPQANAPHHADIRREWPEKAFADLRLGAQDAVITLAHDEKIDDPALLAALAASPFYIGALGSRRTHAARLARLRRHGVDDAAVRRIHAPVGLDIGAKTAEEIALSIVAQVVQTRRRGG